MAVRYYRNAKVFTGVDESSFVSAFAVDDGMFPWAGMPSSARRHSLDPKLGYDESRLVERRTPTRHDLDQVSVTQPIHVLRSHVNDRGVDRRSVACRHRRRGVPADVCARRSRGTLGMR
jgi:predicted amidohydrolase YtcJ